MNGKDLKPEKAKIHGQRNWSGVEFLNSYIEYQNRSLGFHELCKKDIASNQNCNLNKNHYLRLVCVNGKRIA